MKNYAFIDTQNLYLSIQKQGWKIDFVRFRVYLKEKYNVTKAYIFIGYMEEHQALYKSFQEYGYVVIFKPTLRYKEGTTKGNCDAELVLQAMIDYQEYDRAVIVSGDGDFYCLANYLAKNNKLSCILVPDEFRYSGLLKKINKNGKYLNFVSRLKNKLELKKKKAP